MSVGASIHLRNLGKTYRIYTDPYDRLREWLPWSHGSRCRTVDALRDVTLDVPPGACLGLIGANGAGKSTLLKLLAGTTFPTAGTIEVRGRVASLLELGMGFHPYFTGRENIVLYGATLGMSRREMREKLEEIVAFSELADFLDAPIRTYSAGMVCRLAFSVATAIDPDVLLIDEALAVGDMHFQQKCARRFQSYKERGKTIVFASHSLYHVRQICDRAVWLRDGQVEAIGDAVTVTNEYATYESQLGPIESDVPFGVGGEERAAARGEDLPRIRTAELIDPLTGQPRNVFAPNESVAVRVVVDGGSGGRPVTVGVGFFRQEGILCFAHTTELDGVECRFRTGVVTLLLPDVKLLSGEYVPTVWLLDEQGVHEYQKRPTTTNLVIENRSKDLGLFLHAHRWSVEPLAGPDR